VRPPGGFGHSAKGKLVSLLSQGLKNKEIASTLMISEGTVKVYLSRLFQKVGVKDRFELALFGLKNLTTASFRWPRRAPRIQRNAWTAFAGARKADGARRVFPPASPLRCGPWPRGITSIVRGANRILPFRQIRVVRRRSRPEPEAWFLKLLQGKVSAAHRHRTMRIFSIRRPAHALACVPARQSISTAPPCSFPAADSGIDQDRNLG